MRTEGDIPEPDEKAARWLRKTKQRFEGRTPLEVCRTEAASGW
jgi:hypothetical protein